ncbi:Uncharacterised protein [Klebsiella pneumoniae]|nr:hypothetical protein BB745_01367 [Klebsiella pneumoniae]EWF45028.1 hypothetical protein L395_06985 [Klebsiella pneumoniae BWH 2]CAD1942091.1 hypothetical protein AI3007V1_1233 [Klebsiella pneumoniae]CAD2029200.1 hypothetical protein AI2898V1_1231 [Klebsiella pneumoniae]CAE7592661.1 hypothetical protein AI2771V2_1232 [Klebsiella pneumoniae]
MTDHQIAAWCIGYGVLVALVCVSQWINMRGWEVSREAQ